jgi:hypothetical protein
MALVSAVLGIREEMKGCGDEILFRSVSHSRSNFP